MFRKLFGNRNVVVGLWVAFLGFGLYLFNFSYYPHLKVLSRGMDFPEELFGAHQDYQVMFLERLGAAGVTMYRNFILLDFVNTLLLGLVLCSTIYLILLKLEAARAFFALTALPLATAILDVAENIVMLLNLRNLPDLDATLSSTFTALAQAKLVVGTLSLLVLLILIVAFAVTSIGNRFRKE